MTPSLASGVLAGVADAALRALVFAGVMGLVLTVFRVKGAAARLWAWTIVLVAALSMPLVGRAVPGLRWTIPAFAPLARFVDLVSPAARTNMNPSAAGSPSSASATTNASPTREGGALPPSLWAALRVSWPVVALAVYLSGVVLLLRRAAMRWRATRDLERRARVIRDDEALDRLRRHAAIAGLARPPLLAEAAALRVPVAMSVMKPTIVLPCTWRAWSAARLDAVLAHEIAHVARRDTLTQRLSLLYRAVAWFSPLSWWLHRRLAEFAEQASDEAALEAGASRTDYAETLLAFFAELRRAPERAGWHVAMARGAVESAERRVERILSWKGDQSMKLTKRFVLGVLLAAVPVAFFTASVRIALAQATVPAAILAPRVVLAPVAPPAAAPSRVATPAPIAVTPQIKKAAPKPVVKPTTQPAPAPQAAPAKQKPEDDFTKDAYASDTPGLTAPRATFAVEPKYTSNAMRAKIQGTVIVEVVIGTDGTVLRTRVSQSLDKDYGLDEEAVKAAKQWLFDAGKLNGAKVPVLTKLELSFRLH